MEEGRGPRGDREETTEGEEVKDGADPRGGKDGGVLKGPKSEAIGENLLAMNCGEHEKKGMKVRSEQNNGGG